MKNLQIILILVLFSSCLSEEDEPSCPQFPDEYTYLNPGHKEQLKIPENDSITYVDSAGNEVHFQSGEYITYLSGWGRNVLSHSAECPSGFQTFYYEQYKIELSSSNSALEIAYSLEWNGPINTKTAYLKSFVRQNNRSPLNLHTYSMELDLPLDSANQDEEFLSSITILGRTFHDVYKNGRVYYNDSLGICAFILPYEPNTPIYRLK